MSLFKSFARRYNAAAWQTFLPEPELADSVRNAVARVVAPAQIHVNRFIDNYRFLTRPLIANPLDRPRELRPSKAGLEFERIIDRPALYPVWFLAAFPDVASWFCTLAEAAATASNDSASRIMEEVQDHVEALPEHERVDRDGKMGPRYATAMIEAYRRHTRKEFECAV